MQDESRATNVSRGVTVSQRRSRNVITGLGILASLAVAAAIYVWHERQTTVVALATAASHAERNFTASKSTIDAVVSDLAENLAKPTGIQADGITSILTGVESAVAALAAKTEDDPDVRRSQAAMDVQFSATFLALGKTKFAVDSAQKGTAIFRALAAAQPNNNNMQSDVGLSLEKLGTALRAGGDGRGALAADRESLDIARTVAAKEPRNRQFQTDVVLALWRLASAGDARHEHLTEAIKLLKNLKLAAMLTPTQEEWITAMEGDLAEL